MENFIILLKLLFLSNSILLTPIPVNLSDQWLELTPDTTIEAVTSGAHLNVYVSLNNPLLSSIRGDTDRLGEVFPAKTLVAKLIDTNGNEIFLSNKRGFSIVAHSLSPEYRVAIIVRGDKPIIPTDIEFKKIKIMSRIEIKDVKIYWQNHTW